MGSASRLLLPDDDAGVQASDDYGESSDDVTDLEVSWGGAGAQQKGGVDDDNDDNEKDLDGAEGTASVLADSIAS